MKKDIVSIEAEEYGEFKGTTKQTLVFILGELKALRTDVNELKGWKMWATGFGAAAGFIAGYFRDFIGGKP